MDLSSGPIYFTKTHCDFSIIPRMASLSLIGLKLFIYMHISPQILDLTYFLYWFMELYFRILQKMLPIFFKSFAPLARSATLILVLMTYEDAQNYAFWVRYSNLMNLVILLIDFEVSCSPNGGLLAPLFHWP